MTFTSNRFAYYFASRKEIVITEGKALDHTTAPAELLANIQVTGKREARDVAKRWHATPDNF